VSSELRLALNQAVADELDAALSRISHCLGQLTEEQVWLRPREDMNAIGNLLLHLTGNVGQLILSGVGGEPDLRDRPAEFAARGPIPKSELLERLTTVVGRAKTAFVAASEATLCQPSPIKRYDWTGLQAVIRCVAHFRGHTQEIIHMTRNLLGEAYQFAGQR
jgi:hypothetical protein